MVLKPYCASELPGSLVKYRFWGLTPVISDSSCGGQDPVICVSNKFSDDADATGDHILRNTALDISFIGISPSLLIGFLNWSLRLAPSLYNTES